MSSINYKEYASCDYLDEYDFDTASLSEDSLVKIRRLVKEKRGDSVLVPLGANIFSWIYRQDKGVRYEKVSFDSEKIDGLLYIPKNGKKRVYIILNSNKPLISQIYTAAYGYYHYIEDYKKIKEKGYVCDRSNLKDEKEKCACRFAAELLLPKEALDREIDIYIDSRKDYKNIDFMLCFDLIIHLTVKYQIPTKAVFYRFMEKGYGISNLFEYVNEYIFLIEAIMRIRNSPLRSQINELYNMDNKYINPLRTVYSDMKETFLAGYASREEIIADAEKLGLKIKLIDEFIGSDLGEDEDNEEDDEKLFQKIRAAWGLKCQ